MVEVTSFGAVMVLLGVSLFLAWLIESLVEAILGKWIEYFVKDVKLKELIMQVVPLLVGVYAVGFLYQFDFIAWLSVSLSATAEKFNMTMPVVLQVTPFGRIASGLAVGRGASFMHDVISKFLKKPEDLLTEPIQ